MARTPAKNGKASQPTATVLMLPKTKTLTDLLETRRTQKKRADSALGVYRQRLGEAVEKDHLDKWAAAKAFEMAEMEDDTLHVRFFHLMHYLEELGVVERATAQEEMFAGGETGPSPKANGHAKDDEGDEHSAATRVGQAARQIAEKAGASLKT